MNIGVVGGGTMGAGIAEVAARAGCDVTVVEADDAAIDVSRSRVQRSLGRAAKAGRLTETDADRAAAAIRWVTDVADLADREIVLEAVPEDERLKLDVFRTLGKVVASDTLLASNTSSIPLVKMAAVTANPERVIGIHFFNPVPVLPLVEIVESLLTSADTTERAVQFAEGTLGKTSIRSKDRAGFIVNAMLIPYLLSAIRMFESGFATAEDIDRGMVLGCAHPMGPLALVDLIGLDTTAAVAQSMYEEFKEQLFAPPPLLLRMVEAGLLGRKTGHGFYAYPG
jgi:3-hydroxybutyryl-CoA dehydrogenase